MSRLFKIGSIFLVIFVISIFIIKDTSSAEIKIGYVDFIKVFNNYKKTVKVEGDLEKKSEKKQKERDKLVAKIRKLKDELETLSEKLKAKRQEGINQKIRELQEFDQQTSRELLKEKDDAAREIITEFDEVIKEIGKKEGYTFIFNERAIIYSDKTYDLTDKVLKVLNKKYR